MFLYGGMVKILQRYEDHSFAGWLEKILCRGMEKIPYRAFLERFRYCSLRPPPRVQTASGTCESFWSNILNEHESINDHYLYGNALKRQHFANLPQVIQTVSCLRIFTFVVRFMVVVMICFKSRALRRINLYV